MDYGTGANVLSARCQWVYVGQPVIASLTILSTDAARIGEYLIDIGVKNASDDPKAKRQHGSWKAETNLQATPLEFDSQGYGTMTYSMRFPRSCEGLHFKLLFSFHEHGTRDVFCQVVESINVYSPDSCIQDDGMRYINPRVLETSGHLGSFDVQNSAGEGDVEQSSAEKNLSGDFSFEQSFTEQSSSGYQSLESSFIEQGSSADQSLESSFIDLGSPVTLPSGTAPLSRLPQINISLRNSFAEQRAPADHTLENSFTEHASHGRLCPVPTLAGQLPTENQSPELTFTEPDPLESHSPEPASLDDTTNKD